MCAQHCHRCDALTFILYGGMWCPDCQHKIEKAELEEGAHPQLPLSLQTSTEEFKAVYAEELRE